ncbi:Poly(A)+ RNA export protein [Smittium mucronatum]|uniref:Poly(A)+ RNA export protein n=1 Tax=Smittium mucronatum TaxID=133383 RepID=A0A1R0GUB2_9FUNG|nr:Poly(A)+ RNA export protein [Smittium mucronatum]
MMNISAEEKDIEISQPPSDTVSELSFSPQADYLAASSWDNSVRIWEVQSNGTSIGKAMYSHQGPALCCSWSTDGTKLVSGGTDKAGRLFDLNAGKDTQVAAHDAPIRCVRFVEAPGSASPILVTGSWDKTIKYWDLRSQAPIGTVTLPERCYAMDAIHPLLVVATADKKVLVFDLNNPTTIFKTMTSPLKHQTRSISCFRTKDGFALGSIEGRVGIQYLQDTEPKKSFSYKAHREKENFFPTNSVCFNPVFGSLLTAGSDGNMITWDKDAKSRLKSFPSANIPITSTCFNKTGNILAYSVGYDWSKGLQGSNQTEKRTIFLHSVKEAEVKTKSS